MKWQCGHNSMLSNLSSDLAQRCMTVLARLTSLNSRDVA